MSSIDNETSTGLGDTIPSEKRCRALELAGVPSCLGTEDGGAD